MEAFLTDVGVMEDDPDPSLDAVAWSYGADAGVDTDAYRRWIASRPATTRAPAAAAAIAVSILVPVYRPDPVALQRCVESVQAQTTAGWELRLCDDASGDGTTPALLDALGALDPRITILRGDENSGISAATNRAASGARGEFLAFLDQDDELAPDALEQVVAAAASHPTADVLYTDQDVLTPDGQRIEPYFKPGWSPDLLLSHMYVGHLFVIRRHLFEQLGALRTECDGSQDYDLALRATERGRSVVHVPIIGYHWRRAPGSTAVDYGAKPFAHTSAHRALNDAMERRGEQATVDDGLLQSTFRVKRSIQGAPRVSVVVPVVDESHHLQQCLDAIGALAGYDNREVVLVDGGSWKPETKAVLAHASHDAAVKVVSASAEEGRFALHNAGAAHTSGELILFLDPRTTARSAGWLEALVEHAQRPDVGATGARIVFPDGHLAHAGLALGLGDQPAGRAFWGCPPDNSGYWGHGRMVRNWSAVSVDCLMTPRRLFEECGGFDGALAPAFADVDYCLRLRQRGLLVVYTPYAELVLNRPPSWASDRRDGDAARVMRDRWGALLDDDPYFNRNLDRLRPEFALPR